MASYEGLSRVVEIKRKKKKDPLGFKVAYLNDRNGNVSFFTYFILLGVKLNNLKSSHLSIM